MKRNHTKILSVTLTAALIASLIASPTATGAAKKLKATSPKSVTVGKSVKIKTNMKCNFKSSNKKIATVSSKGVVKGKKAGKVKITVTAKKNKQKKTVKITVKKQAKKVVTKTPSTSEPETTPTVIATQPPQGGVPQIPNLPTLMPNRTATPSTSTTPPAIPSPDVPSTQKPSASPGSTSTATPSPTNPSTTKEPIGIKAEFEGKVPINWNLSGPLVATRMITGCLIKTKLIYEDSEEEFVEWEKLDWVEDGNGIVEENGTKYCYNKIKLQNLQTTLMVELVEVPDDVLYPVDLSCSYEGNTLSETQIPDVKDIKTKALMIDGSYREISSTEIRMVRAKRLEEEYECYIAYDYYFEYNGEKLHATARDIIYVPYF